MAKNINNIKGLSTSDILNMDVYKLDKSSLRAVTNRLISSANKRLRRLEKKAPTAPALRQHYNYESGNIIPFSLKGAKSRNDVESVMKRVKSFLEAETSTIKGYSDFREKIRRDIGEFESVEQANDFWKTYNKWIDKHPELYNIYNDSNGLVSMFYDEFVIKGRSSQGASNKITRALNKMILDINEYDNNLDEFKMNDINPDNAFRIKKDL